MKLIKNLALSATVAGAVFALSSCNSENSAYEPLYELTFEEVDFNDEGYWADCYDPATGDYVSGTFAFSHSAWADVWDGVSYPAWNGFCPSKVNDNENHAGERTDYQWGCMPANPYNGFYLVGNSEATVSDDPLDNDKCSLRMTNYGAFNPKYLYVTNSSYTYYCAKNGSDFNPAFTVDDNLMLHVVGVRYGAVTGHLKFPLISSMMFLTQWAFITLDPLGTVDEVLFYVDSTQKNSYGLTIPAYFCITNFGFNLPSEEESL